MKRQLPEPTAVFYERDAMESAVRALIQRGVRPQRIRITQGRVVDATGHVRTAPESGGALVAGLAIGSALGAVLAFGWLMRQADLLAIPLAVSVMRILGGAAAGALAGALLAFLTRPARPHPRSRRNIENGSHANAGARDFVVTVKPPNESAAKDVREFLTLRGGHLLPSA